MMDKLWPRYGLQRNAVHKLVGKVPLEHCWTRHHSLHDIHSAPSSLSSSDSIRNNGAGATQLDDPKHSCFIQAAVHCINNNFLKNNL